MSSRLIARSFTKLLFGLRSGQVTPEQLQSALFCFGCMEGHAREPWLDGDTGDWDTIPIDQVLTIDLGNELTYLCNDMGCNLAKGEALKVHAQVVAALDAAKKDGRALFYKPGTLYQQLVMKILVMDHKGFGLPRGLLSKLARHIDSIRTRMVERFLRDNGVSVSLSSYGQSDISKALEEAGLALAWRVIT